MLILSLQSSLKLVCCKSDLVLNYGCRKSDMLKFSRKVVLVWTDRCFDWMTLLQPQINYIARCVYTVITVCGPRRGKTHHKALVWTRHKLPGSSVFSLWNQSVAIETGGSNTWCGWFVLSCQTPKGSHVNVREESCCNWFIYSFQWHHVCQFSWW